MRQPAPTTLPEEMRTLAGAARDAARELSRASTQQKDEALRAAADALAKRSRTILAANKADVAAAKKAGQNAAFLDRLALDAARLDGIARALGEVASLPDPVGEVTTSWRRPNGLRVKKVRIPLGVVLMVYEARPNVTVDAAALCVKSGNAAILRPGSDALRSALALGSAFAEGLSAAGLPRAAAQVVPTPDREATFALLQLDDLIDLAIPRGGPALIRAVAERSRVPVVKHYQGVCHLFLDASAPPEQAVALAMNGKVQRPGVCNALECLLVHRAAAGKLLPVVGRALVEAGVELRCEPAALAALRKAGVPAIAARPDDSRRLRPGVPRQDPGRAGGGGPRRRPRSHRALRLAPHRGHPDEGPRERPPLRARGHGERRHGERLDPLQRRRRAGARRRDRHFHHQAACLRAHGARRADHPEVRGGGRRTRERLGRIR